MFGPHSKALTLEKILIIILDSLRSFYVPPAFFGYAFRFCQLHYSYSLWFVEARNGSLGILPGSGNTF